MLKTWLSEQGGGPVDPVFPSSRGGPLPDRFTDVVVALADFLGPVARSLAEVHSFEQF